MVSGHNQSHTRCQPWSSDRNWLTHLNTAPLLSLVVAVSFLPLLQVAIAQAPLEVHVEFDERLRAQISWQPASEPSLYTVESVDSLDQEWRPIPPAGQWPIEETQFLDPRATFLPLHRFYRIVAAEIPKPERGLAINTERVDSLSIDEVADWFDRIGISAIEAQSGVDLYFVQYETVNPDGSGTVATGAVIVPTDFSEPLPLFSYQHNTVLDREDVPSRFRFNSLEALIPIFIASQGFITAAPDYLGLGDSPGFHPFLVADAAVKAVEDLLPVAQDIAQSNSIEVVPELYLMGYGEGGHATMAAHREFEQNDAFSLEVIASVPMSGPHDLAETTIEHLLRDDLSYPNPLILPYLLRAYNDVYSFYTDPLTVFNETVVQRVLPRMNGRTTEETINELLGSTNPRSFLRPSFLSAFENDPNHPLRVALRENSVFDWAPKAPLRMYHCDADNTFPKANSEIALDQFFDNGSNFGELFDPIPTLDHSECDGVSFTSGMIWINSERN